MSTATKITGEEGLGDFLELFGTINEMADYELGQVIRTAVDGGRLYKIQDSFGSATNQLEEISGDAELVNAMVELEVVVEGLNNKDRLDDIENSAAYIAFGEKFKAKGMELIKAYIQYIKDEDIDKEMPEWEGGEEVLALYNKLVEKYRD